MRATGHEEVVLAAISAGCLGPISKPSGAYNGTSRSAYSSLDWKSTEPVTGSMIASMSLVKKKSLGLPSTAGLTFEVTWAYRSPMS